eukprot:71256_1
MGFTSKTGKAAREKQLEDKKDADDAKIAQTLPARQAKYDEYLYRSDYTTLHNLFNVKTYETTHYPQPTKSNLNPEQQSQPTQQKKKAKKKRWKQSRGREMYLAAIDK